ncbi:hypothetical protein ACP70R_028371 [Stipagrostis hirtigluma subsp. patula]
MSSSNDAPASPPSQLALSCFEELLDCAVADVASECHRIARLGLDRSVDAEEEELRAWAARATAAAGDHHPGAAEEGGGSKGAVDVFGQTHPAIAADVVECMNCGRPVVAGRFAPHLEKCMGKMDVKLEPKPQEAVQLGGLGAAMASQLLPIPRMRTRQTLMA